MIFDTTQLRLWNNSFHYKQTDFTLTDSLELWRYTYDPIYRGYEGDSVNAIGMIRFERSVPVADSISNIVYRKLWTPYMDFAIYNLSDSAYCYRRSDVVRIASSCRPPDVGGDVIVLDQYILLNPRVCINCKRQDTGVDYCRPVINEILMSLRGKTFEDVPTLVASLPIKVKE